ncbi:uncharacterized protein VTP21DRAFT_6197 [Calcarisporiella thermophila]|uniref:uncharacterized protein n=1 Tax=Calcarisporiella thermophila TaxID=911321 RepID=UPI003742802E
MYHDHPDFDTFVYFLVELFPAEALLSLATAANRHREILMEHERNQSTSNNNACNNFNSIITPACSAGNLDSPNAIQETSENAWQDRSSSQSNDSDLASNAEKVVNGERAIRKLKLFGNKSYINVAAYLNIDPTDARMYRGVLRRIMKELGMDFNKPYKAQDQYITKRVVRKFIKEADDFLTTQGDWAIYELIKQLIHNRRAYQSVKAKGIATQPSRTTDEAEGQGSNIELSTVESDIQEEVSTVSDEDNNINENLRVSPADLREFIRSEVREMTGNLGLIEDLLMEPVKPPPQMSNSRTFKEGMFYCLFLFWSASLAVWARMVEVRLGQLFQALLHAPSSEVICTYSLVTATGFGGIWLWVGKFLESVKAGIL